MSLNKPVLFVLYYDETYPEINRDLYKIIYSVPTSATIFLYKKTNIRQLYSLSIEEEYLLNFTKDFLLFDIDSDISIFLPQIISFCKCQLSIYKTLNIKNIKLITNINKNHFILSNFVRIYREDQSVASFYACLEFILMLQHLFLLLDISCLKNNDIKTNFLRLNNTSITDGIIYKFLSDSQNLLKGKSLTFGFLKSQMCDEMLSIFKRILCAYDLETKIQPAVKKQSGSSIAWLLLFLVARLIRDKSKGHGILFDVRDKLFLLIEACNFLMIYLPEIMIERNNSKIHSDSLTMTFVDINDSFLSILKKDNLKIMNEGAFVSLNPYVLYSDNYGLFLYNGLNKDNTKVLYKNYTQGINLLI